MAQIGYLRVSGSEKPRKITCLEPLRLPLPPNPNYLPAYQTANDKLDVGINKENTTQKAPKHKTKKRKHKAAKREKRIRKTNNTYVQTDIPEEHETNTLPPKKTISPKLEQSQNPILPKLEKRQSMPARRASINYQTLELKLSLSLTDFRRKFTEHVQLLFETEKSIVQARLTARQRVYREISSDITAVTNSLNYKRNLASNLLKTIVKSAFSLIGCSEIVGVLLSELEDYLCDKIEALPQENMAETVTGKIKGIEEKAKPVLAEKIVAKLISFSGKLKKLCSRVEPFADFSTEALIESEALQLIATVAELHGKMLEKFENDLNCYIDSICKQGCAQFEAFCDQLVAQGYSRSNQYRLANQYEEYLSHHLFLKLRALADSYQWTIGKSFTYQSKVSHSTICKANIYLGAINNLIKADPTLDSLEERYSDDLRHLFKKLYEIDILSGLYRVPFIDQPDFIHLLDTVKSLTTSIYAKNTDKQDNKAALSGIMSCAQNEFMGLRLNSAFVYQLLCMKPKTAHEQRIRGAVFSNMMERLPRQFHHEKEFSLDRIDAYIERVYAKLAPVIAEFFHEKSRADREEALLRPKRRYSC